MPRFSIPTIVLAAVTLLLAGGCAGSGGHSGNGGGGGGGGEVAGVYGGTIDFPNGSTATISMEVEDDGAALGHFLVTTPPNGLRAPGVGGFPDGYFTIFGSASGGNIDMEGTASSTPFTVSGTLPEGDGTGPITFTIEGNSFTGTIAKDTAPVAGGSVTYSDVTESNAHTAGFPDGDVSLSFDSSDGFIDIFFNDNTGTTSRSISFNLPSNVQAGDSFTCSPEHHVLSYNEHPQGSFFPNVWAGVSGTVTVTARTGSHITVTLTDVGVEHQAIIGSSTGSFVLNGELHS